MSQFTITFADIGERSGWTSFWHYYPELMLSLGGKFYTIKDGQLWQHNDNENPVRNVFYNQNVVSKIVTILNDLNGEDKIFKTMVLEGNDAWHTKIRTNYTESEIMPEEYNKRESKFYAHIRKNSDQDDQTDRTQGIGVIESINGTVITFVGKIPTLVNTGEQLIQIDGGQQIPIGNIADIVDNKITIGTYLNVPIANAFCFSLKNARVQGSEIRGYFAEVTLTNDSHDRVELYAINSNIVISAAKTAQQ